MKHQMFSKLLISALVASSAAATELPAKLQDFNPAASSHDFVFDVAARPKEQGEGGIIQARSATNTPALVEQRHGGSEGAGRGLDKAESAEDKGDVNVSRAPRPLAVEAGPAQAPAVADAEPKPGADIANAFAAFLTEDDPLSPKRASDIM